jgi:hypothetical protein
MTLDVDAQRKRLTTMLVFDAVCVMVAIASIVGAFRFGMNWLVYVFVIALVAGFGAQIWFIAGFRKAKTGEGE